MYQYLSYLWFAIYIDPPGNAHVTLKLTRFHNVDRIYYKEKGDTRETGETGETTEIWERQDRPGKKWLTESFLWRTCFAILAIFCNCFAWKCLTSRCFYILRSTLSGSWLVGYAPPPVSRHMYVLLNAPLGFNHSIRCSIFVLLLWAQLSTNTFMGLKIAHTFAFLTYT